MCGMIYYTKWDFRNDKLTFCFFQRVEPLNSKSQAKYAGMCQDKTGPDRKNMDHLNFKANTII